LAPWRPSKDVPQRFAYNSPFVFHTRIAILAPLVAVSPYGTSCFLFPPASFRPRFASGCVSFLCDDAVFVALRASLPGLETPPPSVMGGFRSVSLYQQHSHVKLFVQLLSGFILFPLYPGHPYLAVLNKISHAVALHAPLIPRSFFSPFCFFDDASSCPPLPRPSTLSLCLVCYLTHAWWLFPSLFAIWFSFRHDWVHRVSPVFPPVAQGLLLFFHSLFSFWMCEHRERNLIRRRRSGLLAWFRLSRISFFFFQHHFCRLRAAVEVFIC